MEALSDRVTWSDSNFNRVTVVAVLRKDGRKVRRPVRKLLPQFIER